jgi:hypothetical protein
MLGVSAFEPVSQLDLSTVVPVCQLGLSETIQITTSAGWSIQIVMPLDHSVPGRHTTYIVTLIYPYPDITLGHPKQGRHVGIQILTSSLFIIIILMSLWSHKVSDIIVSPPGLITSHYSIPDHGVILLQSGSRQPSSRIGFITKRDFAAFKSLAISLSPSHSFLFLNTDSLIGKTIFHLPKIFDEFLGGARRGEGIP